MNAHSSCVGGSRQYWALLDWNPVGASQVYFHEGVFEARGLGAARRESATCEARKRGADYWNVTCEYRGIEHYVKMTAPPGRTIFVNRNGDPRQ